MTNQDNRPMNPVDLRQKAEALARERADRSPEDSVALSPEEIRKTLHELWVYQIELEMQNEELRTAQAEIEAGRARYRQTLHELRVHQMELEMQNEELRTAQAEIEAGRAGYFDLYNLAPVGYCTLSEKGLILEANLTAATLLGSDRSMLIKQPISRFIFKDDQDIYYLHHKKIFETHSTGSAGSDQAGEPRECELRLVKPDGAAFWVHVTATAAQAEDGTPVSRCVLSDITERKQSEAALRKSEQHLRSTVDGLSAHIAVLDDQGEIILTNKSYREFGERNGLEAGDVSEGTNYLAVCDAASGEHSEAARPFAEGIREVLSGNRPSFELEYPCHSPDEKRWFIGRVTPFTGKGPRRVIVAHENITGRKRVEEALKESEELLETTGRMARVGGWQLDVETMAVTWTKETYHIHEVPLNNKPPLDKAIEFFHPDDRDVLSQAIQRAIDRCEPYDMELRFITAQGNNLWTRTTCQPEVVGGKTVRLRGTLQDITKRKQAEAEQEKLQSQLAQARKMESVGRLAGGVAHDFNNMLGIIIGYADVLMEEMGPEHPFYADITEIKQAGERSADITRQLLAFARKQTVDLRVIDLNHTLNGMLKLLRRLIGEDIDLVWRPGREVWPIRMDPAQIDQMLANLCVNARDAIAGVGKMTIETDNIVFDEAYCKDHAGFVPGAYAMIAVSDNGCGMDSETMSHLYEPFFTTKALGKGTGLGLSTVYGVVKQNNGFVNAYSEPGQGTTFRIYLPHHLSDTVSLPEKNPDIPVGRGHETVLLVEDEPAILKMTTRMLDRAGYTVLAAGTPGDAIRLANEHAGEINLLMTDVVMPEMNGRDLANHILSLYPSLKCLFMSGYTANVIAHHGVLEAGVNYIQKPFSRRDLTVKVREVLEG